MKILFFSHKFYPDIGGIESISEMLANAFVAAGHDVHLMTWTEKTGEKDFPYTVTRNPSFSTIIGQIRWADLLFENNPCIRMSWPNVIFRKPLVTGLQTWIAKLDGSEGLNQRFKKSWLHFSTHLIACSQAVKQQISSRAVVIGNPYNDQLFQRRPAIEKTRDFVFLGRLVSDKGANLAVAAFQQLIQQTADTNATLTIIGDGPEKVGLQQLVQQEGLSKQVVFTGSMRGEALVEKLNQHRFLLVPSLWNEPFGIVALEGMACGCIPIVSDGGGLPDAVGNAGVVFKKGDVQSLLRSMQQLVQQPQLVKDLQQAAPSHLEQHRYRQIAEEYLAVFTSALKG